MKSISKLISPEGYNLWGHLYNIGVGIDQLATTLANGNSDNTISESTGYYATSVSNPRTFWKVNRWIIDNTFWFVEGSGHCAHAYNRDKEERYREGVLPLVGFFTILGCAVLLPFFVATFLIKKIN